MKYNICSPLGRTGSIRLVSILNWHFHKIGTPPKNGEKHEQIEALHLGESEIPGVLNCMINTQPFTTMSLQIIEKFEKENNRSPIDLYSYRFPESFYEISKEYVSLHSHVCTWAVNDDWKNILSTRKNKSELPMSLMIAERTGFWREQDKIDDWRQTENKFYSERPFRLPVSQYIGHLNTLNMKEQMFIEGVKRDTGKHPIIMCLEDSYDTIETKFNFHIEETLRKKMDTYKSKRRPKDYILNYDELIDAYNEYEYQPIERTK